MGGMNESFIVRRPILNGGGGLVGYELDFRHVANDEYDSATNAHKYYAKLLAETFSNFEMDALLGKGLASLELSRAQLQQAQLEAFQWVGHL